MGRLATRRSKSPGSVLGRSLRAPLAEGDRRAADPLPARPLDRRFAPALRDLLGEDASGFSATSIGRLTKQWEADHAAFKPRSLRFHRYAYLFVDGVQMSVRLGEDDRSACWW